MRIDTDCIVSMTEANQNFSQVARLVDEKGSVVIMKNNKPRYLVIDFSEADTMRLAPDDSVLSMSLEIIQKNRKAYEELAK
ncbi:MAG: type II toxin-antitoxin system Phd/YefM family antitoxin [Solobacterium sp.]|nr:type II toxin-antitoxin system Phd/YefM family antitoxin [Solobacterium sp.]